jgi:hypothetical protein
MKHVRSETYLRFTRLEQPTAMQPRTSRAVPRVAEPEPKFRNVGHPTSPIECAKLDDAGSTTRNLLRSILRAVEKK